jgi:hypothetical protein
MKKTMNIEKEYQGIYDCHKSQWHRDQSHLNHKITHHIIAEICFSQTKEEIEFWADVKKHHENLVRMQNV